MADWKTYAKAARNTARRQAPEVRGAAQRAGGRAGDYVRAAGKAIDEGRREDERSYAPPRSEGARDGDGPRRPPREETSTAARLPVDRERLRKDAAAYYTVASRRVASANVVPRIMRSLRDALLIGLSLFVIWGVLAAAGIPIPFSTVLIIVAVIVVASFAGGVYAQWTRARQARESAPDPGV